MSIERIPGFPAEGQQPASGGVSQPEQQPTETAQTSPELVTPAEPIEIVDIAKIEEERRERRRLWNREGQRRWRKKHPDKAYENRKKWRQKPEVKAREAAAARERYWRKKAEATAAIASLDIERLGE